MRNEFYLTYIKNLPAGVEKWVAETMLQHRGKEMSLPRTRLVAMAASRFSHVQEIDRKVRRAIEMLREDGWLIGMSHAGDGYFLIISREEYEEFRDQYTRRAYTIIGNAEKMDLAAKRVFAGDNDAIQVSLF